MRSCRKRIKSLIVLTCSFLSKIISSIYRLFNVCKFHLFADRVGAGLRAQNKVYLKNCGELIIGRNFNVNSGSGINPICKNICASFLVEENAKLVIGNNVGVSSPCIWAKSQITIGDNVLVGGNCLIIDNDAHSLDWRIRASGKVDGNGIPLHAVMAKTSPISIENDVMIGANCTILKGVTIGARSVIGAGSVVSRNIPEDCIAVGNPCQVIRRI